MKFFQIQISVNYMINMVRKELRKEVVVVATVIFSPKCSVVVVWVEEEDQEVLKRENQFNIPLKLLSKKSIKEKQQKLQLIGIEFAQYVMVKVAKMEPTQHVPSVRVEVKLPEWQCLDQECIPNQLDHVMIAVEQVNKLMKQTNAKTVMVRKLSRKRRSLKPMLIRVLHMEKNMFSMVSQMNIQTKKQVMSLL